MKGVISTRGSTKSPFEVRDYNLKGNSSVESSVFFHQHPVASAEPVEVGTKPGEACQTCAEVTRSSVTPSLGGLGTQHAPL